MTTPIIILLLYLYYNTGNKNLEMKKEKNFVKEFCYNTIGEENVYNIKKYK